MLFVIKSAKTLADAPEVTGACTELGQTRQISDNTQTCPVGYEGVVIETCRIDNENHGEWDVTEKICKEVTCSGGYSVGKTRKLSCINGMVGTEGIIEQCTPNGIWKVIDSHCNYKNHLSCKRDGDIRKAQACDWGKAGFALQTCTNSKWDIPTTAPNFQCTEIKCGTDNIGDTRTLNTCGTNYTGNVVEVCTIDGSWEATSIGSTCSPVFGSCNSNNDDTKDINCPPGKEGQHILKCIDNDASDYWTTLEDNCRPIQCSGEKNIGTVRVKEGVQCPNNANGRVMEYCDNNGVWQEVRTNCVTGICESPNDGKGNAFWPTTIGGNTANFTSCMPGYEAASGTPSRQCNSDGTWSDTVTNSCTRITCTTSPVPNATITTDDDASYPLTFAGESEISGSCPIASLGSPISDCSIEGDWENERLSCVAQCPIKHTLPIPGVALWLDANHKCTVLSSDCDNYTEANDLDVVNCWKDKSGNDNHAVPHNAHYGIDNIFKHDTINGRPSVEIPYHWPNGNGYNLKIKSGNTISDANENITLFFVAKLIQGLGGTSPGVYFAKSTGGFGYTGFVKRPWGGNGQKIRSEYSSSVIQQPSSYTLGTTYVYTYRKNAGTMQYFINGVEMGDIPVTTTANNSGTWLIGGALNQRGENILYESTLSDINTKRIEFYLGSKWGVDVLNVSVPNRLWLDGYDEKTVYTDALCTTNAVIDVDNVRCWADKSGNGHDAKLVLTDDFAPLYVSSGMNEKPSLSFNDDRLDFDSVGNLITSAGGEGFIAFHSKAGVSTAGLWQASHKSHSHATTLTLYTNGNVRFDSSFALTAGNGVTTTFSTPESKQGTNMLYNPLSVTGEWSARLNGKLEYTKVSNPGINFTGEQFIGRGRSFHGYDYLDGHIGEIITYDGKLSDVERDHVEYYLTDKWNIPLQP